MTLESEDTQKEGHRNFTQQLVVTAIEILPYRSNQQELNQSTVENATKS